MIVFIIWFDQVFDLRYNPSNMNPFVEMIWMKYLILWSIWLNWVANCFDFAMTILFCADELQCMDIGFHNCVARALLVHVSAEENIRRSLQVRWSATLPTLPTLPTHILTLTRGRNPAISASYSPEALGSSPFPTHPPMADGWPSVNIADSFLISKFQRKPTTCRAGGNQFIHMTVFFCFLFHLKC